MRYARRLLTGVHGGGAWVEAPSARLRGAAKLTAPAERFALDAGDVERLYYGFSVLHCLPVGMVGENAAGTGTVMREDTVREFAEQAGFTQCDVAPIESDVWRFYVLTP
jgi:hypothetical protein